MFEKLKKVYLDYRKYIFITLAIVLLIPFIKILYENIDLIIEGIYAVKEASKFWIFVGFIIFFSSVIFNALILILLSFKKLPFVLTFKEQSALLFVNKILPSGLGQLTLNSYYLHKEGNTKPQTASIITTKAITAGIAFLVMIAIFVYLNINILISIADVFNLRELSFEKYLLAFLIGLIFIAIIFTYLVRHKSIQKKLLLPLSKYTNELTKYKNHPEKILLSIFLAMLVALAGAMTLWASANAVGVYLLFSEVLFIYYLSTFVAAIIPVPGGIGTTEIGLYLGFYILGYDPLVFLSAILIYRFINYWIPLVLGYIFFLNLRKNILDRFTLKHDRRDKLSAGV